MADKLPSWESKWETAIRKADGDAAALEWRKFVQADTSGPIKISEFQAVDLWLKAHPKSNFAKHTSSVQLPHPFKGLEAIVNFLAKVSSANFFLRLGEVLLGLILVSVGVAKLTTLVPPATRVAKLVRAV